MTNVLIECLIVVLSPLLAGLLAYFMGRRGAHSITIVAVGISFFVSLFVAKQMFWDESIPKLIDLNAYTWASIGTLNIPIGFMLDPLTVLMMVVVSFVSWMVHIYTIGYMADDPGYERFFSYIALFTFSMLMLVMSNNFLQLFFGWEGVGLMSYLLIGFWYKRESAIFASLKAFLVNRVGDFGFLLGISVILSTFGALDYATVFKGAIHGNVSESTFTLMGILLFIGAMGKSAQIPLHVWLPDSMEGPTPISALIHAATMVTAGVFMVARLSPIFEHSETALSFILMIGTATCFLMGLLGIVQNDIKRVIAYSTLSQLGYMVVALGVSAYSAGIFHLVTHAFFKALLFLGAGSVIIALHHEQDIRLMGGLRRPMPITYVTMLIGSLALIGFPFLSGFYSKDTIIEAVHLSRLPFAPIAYWFVLGSVFITALYSFRMFFLVFHTTPRSPMHAHESPLVVWGPLVALAIPSILAGIFLAPILKGYFGQSIFVLEQHHVMATIAQEYPGFVRMALHGFISPPFWLGMAGIAMAWLAYVKFPLLSERIREKCSLLYSILINKYGFDAFNQTVVAAGTRMVGWLFWRVGDEKIIDGVIINGGARLLGRVSNQVRRLQTGYIYHYAFAMITGLIIMLIWLVWRAFGVH